MKMSAREVFTLGNYLSPELTGRTISDARHTVSLSDRFQASLVGRPEELAGRSVLLAVSDQLISAVAMTEIDGLARRMLLCPPDLGLDHVRALIEDAGIDAIVTDQPARWSDMGVYQVAAARLPVRAPARVRAKRATEWLLLMPGTPGLPTIVGNTLEGLCRAIGADGPGADVPTVWATFDDIHRYEGLQIFLRAIIGGGSMVLSEPGEPISDYVARLASRGVTHISGAPSHWRKLLTSGPVAGLAPRYVRLSGEIADQTVLDGLKHAFPGASIDHVYASTEAGGGFAVDDGRGGFSSQGGHNIVGSVRTIDLGNIV
jgi:non-ribosomal peptide synthetase component F